MAGPRNSAATARSARRFESLCMRSQETSPAVTLMPRFWG